MSEEIDTIGEVWKTIPEFPNYSVSNFGRLRKDIPTTAKSFVGMLHPQINTSGYLQTAFCYLGRRRTRSVARLVAQAFLGPDPLRPEVNHKNGIKTDNRVENLEWMTHTENVRHAEEFIGVNHPKGEAHGCAKLNADNIIAIRRLLNSGTKQRDIAATFGVKQVHIWRIKHGHNWRHVP